MRNISLNEKSEEFSFESLLERAAGESLENLFMLPEGDYGNTHFHKGRLASKKVAENVSLKDADQEAASGPKQVDFRLGDLFEGQY